MLELKLKEVRQLLEPRVVKVRSECKKELELAKKQEQLKLDMDIRK